MRNNKSALPNLMCTQVADHFECSSPAAQVTAGIEETKVALLAMYD